MASVALFRPASSPGVLSRSSARNPRRSAQRRYIRTRNTAMRSMRSRRDASAPRSIAISAAVLALAGTFERRRDRLGHRGQLAGGEAHERDAGAVRITRAAWTIPVAIEGRSIAALQAV